MPRRWKDPRDGRLWLINELPFDFGSPTDAPRSPLVGWNLVFLSGGERHRELPVGYDLGANLGSLADRELIALLDAAALDD